MQSYSEMTQAHKCSLCGNNLCGTAILVPTKEIAAVYKALLQTTNIILAKKFLAASASLFESYCPRCWIHKVCYWIGFDDEIPHSDKLKYINDHIEECLDGLPRDTLYTWLGIPPLN